MEAHYIKLHAKFGKARPYGKILGDLASFPYISQWKTCDPWGGAKFDPRAISWALLVEDHKIKVHGKFGKPRPYG